MDAAAYPAELPPPLAQGLILSPAEPAERTATDLGLGRLRPVALDVPELVDVQWRLRPGLQQAHFEAWFHDSLQSGTLPGWVPLPLPTPGGAVAAPGAAPVLRRAVWLGQPSYRPQPGGRLVVQGRLLVLEPATPIDPPAGPPAAAPAVDGPVNGQMLPAPGDPQPALPESTTRGGD